MIFMVFVETASHWFLEHIDIAIGKGEKKWGPLMHDHRVTLSFALSSAQSLCCAVLLRFVLRRTAQRSVPTALD
jgi:hypothetical protein